MELVNEQITAKINLVKEYKETEVGLIPKDWEVDSLTDISKITRLAGYEYSSVWKEDENGEIIALRGFNIGKNKIIERDFVRIANTLSLKLNRSRLFKGNVIYPCVGTIGNAAVIDEDNKYHIQQNIAKIIPDENKINPTFLAYYLMSDFGQKEIDKFNGSSSQPNILVGSLRKYSIIVPILTEQTAIATALSDTDDLINSLEKLIDKKRNIKQGAMQKLLQPKDGWEVKKLGECLLKRPDYGINAAAVDFDDTLPTYLRITDISDGGKYLNENKVSVKHNLSSSYFLENGDIVFARTGASVGKTYMYNKNDGKLVFAGFLIRVKVNPAILNSLYLFYLTQTNLYRTWVMTNSMRSGQPGLNSNEYQSFQTILPVIEEQTRIATILSDMDNEITALENKLEKYREIKLGMMQNLLTGKIRLV